MNTGGGLVLAGAGKLVGPPETQASRRGRAKAPTRSVAKGEAMALERGAEPAGDRGLSFSFSELGRGFGGITGVRAAR